jgi:uncharacterized protein
MTEEHDHGDHGHEHHHHEHVSYPDAVRNYRADRDEMFRMNPGSPIPVGDRAAFTGLPYFEVDAALRFEGLELEPYTGVEPADFQIPTTTGQLRGARRAGVFRFELGGMTASLTAYVFETDGFDTSSVFVPFLDSTSGGDTYGAGRYLDLEREADGTYSLDFNLAYHPLCVYDPKFSCPLTPAENRLPVRIEAGERLAPGHD